MPIFRVANAEDIPTILPMMQEFYAFERIPYDEVRATRLLATLLSDPRNGRLIVMETNEVLAGYMIIGFGFSIEFGGRDALLDELFVAPEYRGKGIGARALEFAFELCRREGIEALHLEADHFNERAHDLYLRLGFKDHERHLMSKWLKQA